MDINMAVVPISLEISFGVEFAMNERGAGGHVTLTLPLLSFAFGSISECLQAQLVLTQTFLQVNFCASQMPPG
jgi:hypothetical protein